MFLKLIDLQPSKDGKHKLKVLLLVGKRLKQVHFGAFNMKDYTIYSKDDEEVAEKHKEAYLKRHSKSEDWKNPLTPGFWSRWLLWNKPTLKESLQDVLQRFNL